MRRPTIKTKIKIWLFSLVFLFFQLGWPLLVYASGQNNSKTPSPQSQKCGTNAPVCLQTPASLVSYLEFQSKAIALMQADPFETTTEQITQTEWGLLTNKVLNIASTWTSFSPLGTDLLRELELAASNLLIGTATSTALFVVSASKLGIEGIMSFLILFQERPIVRDRAKLLDIERNISETIYILGQKGKIWRTIKDSFPLQALIREYQELGILSADTQIDTEVSYLTVLKELNILNLQVKAFLSTNSTGQFKSINSKLKINPERISQLKNDYRCARWTLGFSCSDDVKSFRTNLNILLSNTKNTGSSALHKINSSLLRLKMALQGLSNFRSKKVQSLTSEELELLRSVYWLDTTSLTDEQLSSRSPLNLSNRSKAQWQQAKKDANTFISNFDEERNQFTDQFSEEQNTTRSARWTKQALNQIQEETKNLILNHKNQTLHEQINANLAILIAAEQQIKSETELNNNILTTNQFGILSYQIQQIAKEIWDKQSGIRKNLSDICNYQCSNHPSSTCYIQ